MINNQFYNNYFKDYFNKVLSIDKKQLDFFLKKIVSLKKNNKVIIIGNGGSASIASHVSVDFCKILKIRAVNFNEANLITCYSNDYGYENWVVEALKSFALKNDIIIFISSSGSSANIVNGCRFAKKKSIYSITFSGFKRNNPLSKIGNLNFWVNSNKYNIIEMTHQSWLLYIVDYLRYKLNNKKY